MSYILEKYPDISYENSVMVGDRIFDINGAKAFSLRSLGVLYRFGSADELSGADFLAGDIAELEKILSEI
jgi:phosphoglycolate phosphatase